VAIKYGFYTRHPWGMAGRETVRVQRHLCHDCQQTYAAWSPPLVAGAPVHTGGTPGGDRSLATRGDVAAATELSTEGLWAKLKDQIVCVVLMTVNSVNGLIYPSS
jgi:hypothetical protein